VGCIWLNIFALLIPVRHMDGDNMEFGYGCIIWVGRMCIATRDTSNVWSNILIMDSIIASEFASILCFHHECLYVRDV
jgi:hypothetical protein